MDAKALLIYKHCLKVEDKTTLPEELLEKYRSCCKVIVRVNQEADFEQLCDRASKALIFFSEHPDADLPAASFIID